MIVIGISIKQMIKNTKGKVIKVYKGRLCVLAVALMLILMVLSGCSQVSAGNLVTIGGTCDIISPFQRKVIPAYNMVDSTQLQANYSSSAVEQVRHGASDIALVGRTLSADELKGLKDQVIAYDAVCIIIDANSFKGGETSRNSIPFHKSDGFKNLDQADLKAIVSSPLVPYGLKWTWNYETWKPVYDLNSTSLSASTWTDDVKIVAPQINYVPGKFDTQTYLYQVLGLDENMIAQALNNQFSSPKYNSEEEVLAQEYPSGGLFDVGAGDFAYKLGFVSRRVIPIALQNVPINVVSIDGIDPMNNTQAIYDGSYLLSRKIHLISQENPSPATEHLINYLISADGQQVLKDIGYLPLPQK